MTIARPRHPGLDTLRACAIALVFMYHYTVFVSRAPTFGWLGDVGWVGVDLFFVLSGYLIANLLFAGLARGERVSLPRFFARRALRTLPLFWLVLAAFALWPAALGGRPAPPWWRFLTFTQNIGLEAGTAFSHAWSLCIEEQFYLLLPATLVLGALVVRGRSRSHALARASGWILIGGLLAVGVACRIVLWRRYGDAAHVRQYMSWVYYATPCRFDEFLPGVALALLKNFHPELWNRLMARGPAIFVCGALATLAMLACAGRLYYLDGVGYGFFMTAFGYSLLALSFALLVMAALSPRATPLRWHVPGAAALARWSYAIYLSHKPLAFFLAEQLKPLGVSDATRLGVIALACVAAGALLHVLVEAPLMALRDRRVPSSFSDGSPVGAVPWAVSP